MHDATVSPPSARRYRIALVLSGGAARGAYEVGVAQHLFDDVARELGGRLPLDILSGTSVGAINACALAAHADDQRTSATRLAAHWTALELRHLLRVDGWGLFEAARGIFGGGRPREPMAQRRGGLLCSRGLERVVARAVPFARIGEQLRARRLHAIAVSTTHVESGVTVVFVQRANEPTVAGGHGRSSARSVTLALEHVLASAAIPFLFPAVRIDGAFYCDGGLRQNVPLSPARRLGADRILVVNTRHVAKPPATRSDGEVPGPLLLVGKALNALTLDRVDDDIDRLERINRLLEQGLRYYGPSFLDVINRERGQGVPRGHTRLLQALQIRPSEDIAAIAADFVRSARFARRVGGLLGRLLRRLADGAANAELLSHLLLDGEFAAELIALGRADARRRHDDLCSFFSSLSSVEEAPELANAHQARVSGAVAEFCSRVADRLNEARPVAADPNLDAGGTNSSSTLPPR